MAKYCWKCGAELRDEAAFCKHCGAEMTPRTPEKERKPEPRETRDEDSPIVEEYPAEEIREQRKAKQELQKQANKDKKMFRIIGIIIGVVMLAAVAGAVFYYGGFGGADQSTEPEESTTAAEATEPTETTADENIAEKLKVVLWDINFSQVNDLDSQPVDVLLKVKNGSTVPVKSVDYSINYSGTVFKNREDGGNQFNAYGYIKPGETGYLYGQIEVPSDTPQKQGDIIIKKATQGKNLGDYQMPYGEIVNFNKEPDTYDVSIKNPNNRTVKPKSSIVIAVNDDKDTLNDAWGCGVLQDTIGENEKMVLTDVIHDPGFRYRWDEYHYSAFVIEKDIIGIK